MLEIRFEEQEIYVGGKAEGFGSVEAFREGGALEGYGADSCVFQEGGCFLPCALHLALGQLGFGEEVACDFCDRGGKGCDPFLVQVAEESVGSCGYDELLRLFHAELGSGRFAPESCGEAASGLSIGAVELVSPTFGHWVPPSLLAGWVPFSSVWLETEIGMHVAVFEVGVWPG